jgi:hypothetical protein
MSDTQVSGAARQMAAQRWGARKPVRMARELALRASELPDPERIRLLNALDLAGGVNVNRGRLFWRLAVKAAMRSESRTASRPPL